MSERTFYMNRRQSKVASAIEALTNTVIGVVIAWTIQFWLFRIYGIQASHGQVFQVVMWMTLVSTARSYVLRRMWNAEFWYRIDWRKPWRLKPKLVKITRSVEMPEFVEGRIDADTVHIIATRLKERADRTLKEAMEGR